METYSRFRLSNFELLRIICMLMIIVGHIIYQHGTIYVIDSSEEIIKLMCLSFCSVAVNTFVLISGFWGLSFKNDKFVRLIIDTFIYSVLLYVLSVSVGWQSISFHNVLCAILPVLTKQYWFVTSYIVLIIISPWLNKWIECFDKREYTIFLLLGFIIIYAWPTISFLLNTSQFIADSGFGIINFIYLYMLGRFLKLHFIDTYSSTQYFCGYLLSAILLFICQFSLSWLLGFEFTSWFSYNTVFVFVGSVCLFMTFKKMSFSSRVVNYWAKPCLAVYLIHFNPFIWDGLCNTIGVSKVHGDWYYFLLFALPFIIYFVCAIIEIGRIKAFSKIEKKILSVFSQ